MIYPTLGHSRNNTDTEEERASPLRTPDPLQEQK